MTDDHGPRVPLEPSGIELVSERRPVTETEGDVTSRRGLRSHRDRVDCDRLESSCREIVANLLDVEDRHDALGARRHEELQWQRHEKIELKGFAGAFTLWSVDHA